MASDKAKYCDREHAMSAGREEILARLAADFPDVVAAVRLAGPAIDLLLLAVVVQQQDRARFYNAADLLQGFGKNLADVLPHAHGVQRFDQLLQAAQAVAGPEERSHDT